MAATDHTATPSRNPIPSQPYNNSIDAKLQSLLFETLAISIAVATLVVACLHFVYQKRRGRGAENTNDEEHGSLPNGELDDVQDVQLDNIDVERATSEVVSLESGGEEAEAGSSREGFALGNVDMGRESGMWASRTTTLLFSDGGTTINERVSDGTTTISDRVNDEGTTMNERENEEER